LCKSLAAGLPKDDTALPPAALHDNVYGRVLDSAIINDLVEKPPKGVTEAMSKTATATADYLDTKVSQKSQEAAVETLQEYLKKKDPRFWFPKVPELAEVRDAKSADEALTALKKYLRSPKTTGPESVSVPWVMVKFWVG